MRSLMSLLLIAIMAMALAACSQTKGTPEGQPEKKSQEQIRAEDAAQKESEGKALLEKNPNDPQGHLLLGAAAYRLGNLEQAVTHYQKVVELDPTNSTAYNYLGNTYRDLKRPAEAEEAYRKAIEADPANGTAVLNLAVFLKFQNRVADAVAVLEAGVKSSPNRHDMWKILGDMAAEAGDKERARAAYEESLRLVPGYAGAEEGLKALEEKQ